MNVPSGLKESVLFHIEAALRIILRRAEILGQENLGLAVRESLIIQAAGSDPALSQGYIADCLGVNRNVMVLEIDRLQERGYVKRERRPATRREATIVLTPKGRRTLAEIAKLRARLWREALRPTTGEQRGDLIAWARSVIEHNDLPPKAPRKKKTR